MSENPFATPLVDAYGPAPTSSSTSAGVWRDGNIVVMERTARLPDVCVKTGGVATQRLARKLHWHHPAVYIALMFNVLIYIIIALIVRKTVAVDIPVSDESADKRKKWMYIGWGCGLGGIAMFILGLIFDVPALAGIGPLTMLFGLIGGLIGARLLWPSKIDEHFVYLRGAKEPFLSRLPQR